MSDVIFRKNESSDWKLVWADEFDQDGPFDASKWTPEIGFVRNREDQWYQPENAQVRNGLLVIEAQRVDLPNPHFDPASPDWKKNRPRIHYTSASLRTRGKHAWMYGRFECRCKIPVDRGSWPAFWTLGTTGQWPANGEIDIMEYYRSMTLANFIWAGGPGGTNRCISVKTPLAEHGGKAWADPFHVWRLDWSHDWMEISVDDRPLNRVKVEELANSDTGFNPYRQPHELIINLAIGGTQALGDASASTGEADPSQTAFPLRMEVDYVRVYQRA